MLLRAIVNGTFLIMCVVIAYTDIQKQKIYNEAVAVLFVPAIVSFFVFPEVSALSRVLGAVSVSGLMTIICLLIPGAFGGGDIKMMVPTGLFLGLEGTLLAGFTALLSAAIYSVVLWCKEQNRKREFAFGPALCIGIVIAQVWYCL